MKHLLIVTYHFPPLLSMGSIRLVRFARYLGNLGWRTDVLTAHTSRYALCDPGIGRLLPVELDVYRESALREEHSGLERYFEGPARRNGRRFRREGFLKNAASALRTWAPVINEPEGWRRASIHVGRQLIQSRSYDCIYSSGGPLAAHSIAAKLSGEFGLPWVAEFRDAIVDNPYFKMPTAWHRSYFQAKERHIATHATRLLATTHALAQRLRNRYEDSVPVDIVRNGYDTSEYPKNSESCPEIFRIVYAGNLYGERSIAPFLKGWKKWLELANVPGRRPLLHIYGQSFNIDLAAHIRRENLEHTVRYFGPRSHGEVMAALATSRAVLVVKAPKDVIHIPGKLFESLGAGRPVFLLGPASEASEIVERLGGGVCVTSTDEESIARGLTTLFAEHEPRRSAPPEFAAERLAGNLAEILNVAASSRFRGFKRSQHQSIRHAH